MDAHEELFDRYLERQGHDRVFEPQDLPTGKRPDFALQLADGTRVVIEVEGIDEDYWPEGQATATLPAPSRRIKNKMRAGAEQLSELADQGVPLIVVIANASGSNFPLWWQNLREAIVGEPHLMMSGLRNGEFHEIWEQPRGGKGRDHQYLSAVANIYRCPWEQDVPGEDKRTEERIPCVDVVAFDDGRPAAPLPSGLFVGPYDRICDYDGKAFHKRSD